MRPVSNIKCKKICKNGLEKGRVFMVELDNYKYALAGYRQAVEEIRNSL